MSAHVDTPKSARLFNAAYSYIVQKIMPEETEVSLPVLSKRDSRLIAVFFGTIVIPRADKINSDMYRPMVTIYVDWEEERVLNHELSPNIVPVDRDKPVALYNPPEFAGPPTPELERKVGDARREIFRLIDEIAPLYKRTDLNQAEQELVARCNKAYRRLVHPDVLPFYQELNPDFFRWLEGTAESGSACSKCGAANPPGSRFCSQCGNKLGS